MKIKGTVKYVDLEGGFYVLEAADGKRYILDGGDSTLLSDGVKAEVTGEVSEGMGIAMTADPILVVSSFELDS